MRLTKNSYIKNACAFAVSFKGRGQSIDRKIVHVAAFCPDRNGVRCWKNLRIDSSHRNFDEPEKVGALGKLASVQISRSMVT